MTFTNDPPLISSIELIPDAVEKADLDAPSTSGGKLLTGQVPNISISSTTVVADAAERLALDVQEGDVAIQTNVSSSFIFTGGDNIATNWQVIDFDAIGAIDGEDINPRDITPRDITASGDIDAGSFATADLSAASNGELLGSDGSGNLSFTSPPSGGDSFLSSASNVTIEVSPTIASNGTLHSFTDAVVYSFSYGNSIGRFKSDTTLTVNFTDNTSITFDSNRFYNELHERSRDGRTQLFHNWKNVSSITASYTGSSPGNVDHFSACIFEEL